MPLIRAPRAETENPSVAPLPKGRHHHDEILAHRREHVFVARAVLADVHALEDTVRDEVLEALREYVLRDGEVLLEVGESPRPYERFANDEERPPIAEHLEGARNRAVFFVKSDAHEL